MRKDTAETVVNALVLQLLLTSMMASRHCQLTTS